MQSDELNTGQSSGLSVAEKITLTATSIAAVTAMPGVAQAGIIYNGSSPISLALNSANGTTATWDVDGANGQNFELYKTQRSGFGSSGDVVWEIGLLFASDGADVVAPYNTDAIQPLKETFNVGPTLANSYSWARSVGGPRWLMSGSAGSTGSGGYSFATNARVANRAINNGFEPGENYIGFRFSNSSAELLYGWANINLDTDSGIVSITEWAYEDTPNTTIHIPDRQEVSAVPEPSTSSLAMLGLGAAGILSWRRRRQAILHRGNL